MAETSLPYGCQLKSSCHSKYAGGPFSTIKSVARYLKNGSNSFNSKPYSKGCIRMMKVNEKARISIPIISRERRWCDDFSALINFLSNRNEINQNLFLNILCKKYRNFSSLDSLKLALKSILLSELRYLLQINPRA